MQQFCYPIGDMSQTHLVATNRSVAQHARRIAAGWYFSFM